LAVFLWGSGLRTDKLFVELHDALGELFGDARQHGWPQLYHREKVISLGSLYLAVGKSAHGGCSRPLREKAHFAKDVARHYAADLTTFDVNHRFAIQ